MNGRNEMNIPEYNVQVRVKNNYFLRRMAEKGFASSAALARACDVNVYRMARRYFADIGGLKLYAR